MWDLIVDNDSAGGKLITSLVIVVIAAVIGMERITPRLIAGVALVVAGVIAISVARAL